MAHYQEFSVRYMRIMQRLCGGHRLVRRVFSSGATTSVPGLWWTDALRSSIAGVKFVKPQSQPGVLGVVHSDAQIQRWTEDPLWGTFDDGRGRPFWRPDRWRKVADDQRIVCVAEGPAFPDREQLDLMNRPSRWYIDPSDNSTLLWQWNADVPPVAWLPVRRDSFDEFLSVFHYYVRRHDGPPSLAAQRLSQRVDTGDADALEQMVRIPLAQLEKDAMLEARMAEHRWFLGFDSSMSMVDVLGTASNLLFDCPICPGVAHPEMFSPQKATIRFGLPVPWAAFRTLCSRSILRFVFHSSVRVVTGGAEQATAEQSLEQGEQAQQALQQQAVSPLVMRAGYVPVPFSYEQAIVEELGERGGFRMPHDLPSDVAINLLLLGGGKDAATIASSIPLEQSSPEVVAIRGFLRDPQFPSDIWPALSKSDSVAYRAVAVMGAMELPRDQSVPMLQKYLEETKESESSIRDAIDAFLKEKEKPVETFSR